jgi:hypothetical protein
MGPAFLLYVKKSILANAADHQGFCYSTLKLLHHCVPSKAVRVFVTVDFYLLSCAQLIRTLKATREQTCTRGSD